MPNQTTISVEIGFTVNIGDPNNREFARVSFGVQQLPVHLGHEEQANEMVKLKAAFAAVLAEVDEQVMERMRVLGRVE